MRIALVGFGSVGRSFALLLRERRDALYAREGLLPTLVGVIDSRGAALSERGLDVAELVAAKQRTGSVAGVASGVWLNEFGSADRLLASVGADVLVEASPSHIDNPLPALANLRAGMSRGMHAVTVNKAPLAVAMSALTELAQHNGVMLRFSGAVGAGTPVLSVARSLARGDTITSVRAILNGTTNYILWSMTERSVSYADALAEAQAMGLAESDPSADVDGVDTGVKLVILANAVLGARARFEDVRREGIRGVSAQRVREASGRGKVIKLIGRVECAVENGAHADGGGAGVARVGLSVAPEEVDRHGPLDVQGTGNAVEFTTAVAGVVSIVGAGAGGPQTAVAILRDLVDIWHHSSEQRP